MSVKNVKVNDSERSIDSYFNEIKNMNPLSKKDERKLWKRYREKNDMQARESLINANLKFVPTVAKHFKGCGLPLADIIEEGNIGLIQAVDRFDPKKDAKIISYAVWWIRKTILEAIEKKGMIDADNIDDFLPTEKEIENEINEIASKAIVPERNNFSDEHKHNPIDAKQLLEELFEGVPERERNIISDYYGLDGVQPRTFKEISEDLNLTIERVRQLNEKGLKKMRSNALLKNLNFKGF